MAISAGASGNRIGTDGNSVDDVGERNVIAGSNNDGIDIYGTGTDGNIVAGNFIGTDVTGTRSLGIVGDGVFLAEGPRRTGSGSIRQAARRFMTRAMSFPGTATMAFKSWIGEIQRDRREQDRNRCLGDGRCWSPRPTVVPLWSPSGGGLFTAGFTDNEHAGSIEKKAK